MTIPHVKSTDADTITKAITSYLQEKNLNCRKLVGQGYDGAATFYAHADHAHYIHCYCHQLQLASIQAENYVLSVKRMFVAMLSLLSLFYYSPQKAESLKHVQAVLNLPELKVIKPSDTRWLSHECCVCAILKELYTCIDHHFAKHL